MTAVQEKGLQTFYPPNSPALDQIANRATQQVEVLAQQWRIPREIAQDIVRLALYDVVLYIDDSGSMAFEENGERIDDLKLILNRVAFAASLFDDDGVQVRFMNNAEQGNGIRNEQMVAQMITRIKFSGMTPMGRELQNKILQPLVLQPARAGQLRKPVLVITITDGQPTGESPSDISRIIKNAVDELGRNPRCGKGAIAFQFAQVGNDLKAREFLSKLDEDPSIGDVIDCTSSTCSACSLSSPFVFHSAPRLSSSGGPFLPHPARVVHHQIPFPPLNTLEAVLMDFQTTKSKRTK